MVATTTRNHSILPTLICWSFPLSAFYRSSAEHLHENIQWNVCLNQHAFISNNLMPLSSPFTLMGWIPGAMPCQRVTLDFSGTAYSVYSHLTFISGGHSPIGNLGTQWMGVIITTPFLFAAIQMRNSWYYFLFIVLCQILVVLPIKYLRYLSCLNSKYNFFCVSRMD